MIPPVRISMTVLGRSPIPHALQGDRNERFPWLTGALLLTLSASLHLQWLTHAGPMWRDEINSVSIASLPTLAGVYEHLQYDSFPIGWFIVLRGWLATGGGSNLRLFGTLTGLALLVGSVVSAGWAIRRPPLILLSLVLLNGNVIVFGDSIRGNGAGLILGLATWLAALHLSRKPSLAAIAIFALVAAAAVQLHYYNAVTVAACCAAAAASLWSRKNARWSIASLAAGVFPAVTLLPYLEVFSRAKLWSDAVKWTSTPLTVWIQLTNTLLSGGGWGAVVLWHAATAAVLALSVFIWRNSELPADRRAELLFHLTTLATGSAGTLAFLLWLRYEMAPWYFLTYLLIWGLACDGVLSVSESRRNRILTVACALAASLLGFSAAHSMATTRMTDVDSAAAYLEKTAAPRDLVVLANFQAAIPFGAYYRGVAPWSTVPPIPPQRWHRYDLFVEAVHDRSRTIALLQRVDRVLAGGGSVYLMELDPRRVEIPLHSGGPLVVGLGNPLKALFDYLAASAPHTEELRSGAPPAFEHVRLFRFHR